MEGESQGQVLISPERVMHLAQLAGLDLRDRTEKVAAALAGIMEMVRRVERLELGDAPPATAFDARWVRR